MRRWQLHVGRRAQGPGGQRERPRAHREDERASIAVASNAPFSEWGSTFTDPRLAAAVVDRLTFRAHILETGSSSYRLRTSRAKRKEEAPAA